MRLICDISQIFLLTAEALGFRNKAYLVDEGDHIDICLSEISAKLEKEIVVIVVSSDGTATCKYIRDCNFMDQ